MTIQHGKTREFCHGDPRKFKRHMRAMGGATYEAYIAGQSAAEELHSTNPYPPGIRHDEWNRGFASADPLGDYLGRNQ